MKILRQTEFASKWSIDSSNLLFLLRSLPLLLSLFLFILIFSFLLLDFCCCYILLLICCRVLSHLFIPFLSLSISFSCFLSFISFFLSYLRYYRKENELWHFHFFFHFIPILLFSPLFIFQNIPGHLIPKDLFISILSLFFL